MNLILGGPCGVGKSTVAAIIANRNRIDYLDFDSLGILDMQKHKGIISPFSASKLNLRESIPTILSASSVGFVLDIGGDTLFRKNVDNNERLEQILWVKATYFAPMVVLTATKDVLQSRFFATKERRENGVDDIIEIWKNWQEIAEPYLKLCGDIFIDTSLLSINDVVNEIEATLKRRIIER